MSFSENEISHYRELAGMIINGDETKKRKLDSTARLALAAARAAMPDAGDDVLVAFFATVVLVMARLLATPMQEAATVIESVFDNYTLAAAQIMGAYNLDDSSDVPRYEPPKQEQQERDDAKLRAELDALLNRQYM